jgi:hypothetical protein
MRNHFLFTAAIHNKINTRLRPRIETLVRHLPGLLSDINGVELWWRETGSATVRKSCQRQEPTACWSRGQCGNRFIPIMLARKQNPNRTSQSAAGWREYQP